MVLLCRVLIDEGVQAVQLFKGEKLLGAIYGQQCTSNTLCCHDEILQTAWHCRLAAKWPGYWGWRQLHKISIFETPWQAPSSITLQACQTAASHFCTSSAQ